MTIEERNYTRLRNILLGISLVAWLLLLRPGASSASCCGGDCAAATLQLLLASHPSPGRALELVLAANPPGVLAQDWTLMLLAMMLPMLVQPIYHIRTNSLARRRLRSTILFVVGYGTMWLAAGSILLALALAAKALVPAACRYLPAVGVGLVAVVWQASPFKQRCLNRGHRHRALAAFGSAADFDALRMGLEHGQWCIASCWAAMLLPLLLPHGHLLVMGFVSALMFCERLDPPRAPSWRWRGFGTVWRYLILRWLGPQHGTSLKPLRA